MQDPTQNKVLQTDTQSDILIYSCNFCLVCISVDIGTIRDKTSLSRTKCCKRPFVNSQHLQARPVIPKALPIYQVYRFAIFVTYLHWRELIVCIDDELGGNANDFLFFLSSHALPQSNPVNLNI